MTNVYRKTLYLVPGTTYVLKLFFRMGVPGTKCGQKNFENFFGPKKGAVKIIFFLNFLGDFVPWNYTRRIFSFKISELIYLR
jgi:hypothetical protein